MHTSSRLCEILNLLISRRYGHYFDKLSIPNADVRLAEFDKGDYTSSVAFKIAPYVDLSPQQVASVIIRDLDPTQIKLEKIEAVNGHINMWLSRKELIKGMG